MATANDSSPESSLSYKDSGVDIAAGDQFAAQIQRYLRQTCGPNVIENPGGYAGLYELKPNDFFAKKSVRPVLAGSTDGVGTKLRIAFMMGKHDTVGIDLVAMSVNDLVCVGAQPLFFLDYMATGKLAPEVMLEVIKGISAGCREAQCALLGGETAEMPGFYQPGEYDLAGFAVGLLERRRWISGKKVQPGDKVVGIASSGIHSNGYSLVRKLFFDKLGWDVGRHVDELGCTLGEELLRPTRIYVRPVLKILSYYRVMQMVRGIAHITGGGFVGNIPRVLPSNCGARIVGGTWPVPPIFNLIRKLGKIDEAEMYRVFNMGIGMVLITAPAVTNAVLRRLARAGEQACLIGEIVEGEHKVTIE